jgi:hypothetical protein
MQTLRFSVDPAGLGVATRWVWRLKQGSYRLILERAHDLKMLDLACRVQQARAAKPWLLGTMPVPAANTCDSAGHAGAKQPLGEPRANEMTGIGLAVGWARVCAITSIAC